MKQKIGALTFIVFVLFLVSCKPEIVLKIDKPDLFLSENQMIQLFVDAQLVEGALAFKRNKGSNITELKHNYYEIMFINHGITEKVFEENIAYYNQFPEVMEKMYDEVLANLSKTKSLMEVKEEE